MLRRPTRYVTTSSESSEDDRSHPKRQVRMPVSNVQVRQFSENHPYSTGRNSSANKSTNTSNSFLPYLTRLRSRIPPSSNSYKSSSSESDDSVQPTQRKSLRALSDYDTGTRSDTRSDKVKGTMAENILSWALSDYDLSTRSDEANGTNPEKCFNSLSAGSNSVQNNAAFEFSSDGSSNILTASLKRRKTSVINLASSTDSSDSGVPIQVGRASGSGKRTRLCMSSDGIRSTDDSSSENNKNALEYTMGNIASTSNLSRHSRENERRIRAISERSRTIQRLTATRQNQISAPSSSRQNSITATSENRIPRSSRQMRRRPSSRENDLRPNTIQLRSNRPTTSATTQNPVPNTDTQNNIRPGRRVQNNMTITLPTYRQLQTTVQNPSNASISNRLWEDIINRPSTSRENNTITAVNWQNSVRPLFTRARLNNRRTSTNRQTLGRTTTNSTSTATRRQNIAFTGPPIRSDPETGFSLRISMRNGQNTCVRNPLIDSRLRLDRDSSSDSSSDDVRPVLRRRRVIFSSDNNTSTDSEASSVFVNRSRRRVHRVISENESAEVTRTRPVMTSNKIQETIISDSDGESEKCPICFGRFNQQEVGTPKTCAHCFCLECIKKWAENNNTCPVDRRKFSSIIVRAKVQGEVIREDSVPPRNNMALHSDDSFVISFSDSDSDTSDDVVFFEGSDSDFMRDYDTRDYDGPDEICTVCMLSNNVQQMLPCDACDNVYHMRCVNPPLQAIPLSWVCPECVQAATVGGYVV